MKMQLNQLDTRYSLSNECSVQEPLIILSQYTTDLEVRWAEPKIIPRRLLILKRKRMLEDPRESKFNRDIDNSVECLNVNLIQT